MIGFALVAALAQTPGEVPEDRQCGVYAGFVALEAMGDSTSLDELRRRLGKGTREGYSIQALATALSGGGVEAHPVKMSLDELQRVHERFVFVPYMRSAHFLVLERFDTDNVDLIDPPGVLQVTRQAFEQSWDGYGLLLLPTGRTVTESIGPPPVNWKRWAGLTVGVLGLTAAACLYFRRGR